MGCGIDTRTEGDIEAEANRPKLISERSTVKRTTQGRSQPPNKKKFNVIIIIIIEI